MTILVGKVTSWFRPVASMISVTSHPFSSGRPITSINNFIFLPLLSASSSSSTAGAVDLGGHGPIQPTHPRHLGDQFPHLPVALPQSQPLGVRARQPRLPQPQRQAEGGMELEVTGRRPAVRRLPISSSLPTRFLFYSTLLRSWVAFCVVLLPLIRLGGQFGRKTHSLRCSVFQFNGATTSSTMLAFFGVFFF